MKRRALRVALVVVLLLVVGVAGIGYWIAYTPGGAQLVLNRVASALGKGAKIEGVEGSLGGPLRVKLIVVDRPDFYVRIEDVTIDSSFTSALRGTLLVHKLDVRSVELRTAGAAGAARAPVSFTPPYHLILRDGRIGTFTHGPIDRKGEDLVLRDIVLKGEGDKSRWKIDEAAVVTPYGAVRVAGTLGNAKPYAVDLTGRFEGRLQEQDVRVEAKAGGTLERIEARVEGTVASAQARALAIVEPFSASPVKSVDVDARGVDLSRFAEGAPATRLVLAGKLTPQGQAISGPVRVTNEDPGPWDAGKLPFQSASARIVAAAGRLDATDLQVALAGGGAASGKATVRKGIVEADLEVTNVDLAALHRDLQKTQVTGRITLAAEREAQRFDVALKDPRFAVEGRAALAGNVLDVETARITTGSGAVTGKGTLALKGTKEFRFEGRAEHFDPSAFVKSAPGDLNFTFVTSGTLAKGIAGDAKLDIAPSTLAGQPASGRVHVAGSRERIANADIDVVVGEASVLARGSFGRAGDAMDITFRVPNLSTVAKPFGVALAGRAEGTARLTGTFAAPAGEVSIDGSNLTLPSNVFVAGMQLRGRAGTDPESPIDATLQAKGVAVGEEKPPTSVAESVRATLKGTRRAHRFEADVVMDRRTSVSAALQGGIDPAAKALAWNGRIESLEMKGRGAFALTAPAPLSLSAARVELGDATLRGEWGEARLAQTRWTPRTLDFKGSTTGLKVQNVSRTFRLARLPASDLVIAGDWDIHASESFNGTLNIHRVSGDLRLGNPPLPLGLRELVLRMDATNGRARASLDVTSERVGRVEGEGTGVITHGDTGWTLAKSSPISARIVARLPDLAPLQPWLGPESRLAGRLDANITVSGTGAEPRLAGDVQAHDIALREPQTGFEVEQGDVVLRMDGRTLRVERFFAKTPWRPSDAARERMRRVEVTAETAGTISAEGVVDVVAHTGNLRFKADKAVLTQLPKRFLAVSGEATLQTDQHGPAVVASLKADAGWVGALDQPLPTVSEDVVVVRKSSPAPAAVDEEEGREPLRLDVNLDLNNHMWFQGRGLDTRLDGSLHVTGQLGTPLRASGTIRTVGGTYRGYGQELTIERGVLAFNGPIDNPRLNVLALRKGLAVEAGVEVTGSTTHPRVRLVSTPDVPEPEKLSWLVLGRGAADASIGDVGVMLAAARAALGNNDPGGDITKKLGIDEVRIGKADTNSVLGVLPQSTVAGRTGTPAASDVVSVGKHINRNLQLTYEQGLADMEGALRLTYRVTRQFQILARAGYLPGIDAVYRWTFGEQRRPGQPRSRQKVESPDADP
jgi:translocation and assembly module TamB